MHEQNDQSEVESQHQQCHCHKEPPHRIRQFLEAMMMLSLTEGPAHGYVIMERLTEDYRDLNVDPGGIYRTLRRLDEDGLVTSEWDTSDSGPAKRIYKLTPEGVEYLSLWKIRALQMKDRLNTFLHKYGERDLK